jgi:hypothetical protein
VSVRWRGQQESGREGGVQTSLVQPSELSSCLVYLRSWWSMSLAGDSMHRPLSGVVQ